MRIFRILLIIVLLVFMNLFTVYIEAKDYKMLNLNEIFIPFTSEGNRIINVNFNNIAKKESPFYFKFIKPMPENWKAKIVFKGLAIQNECFTETLKYEENDTLELRISAPDEIINNLEFNSKILISSLKDVSISEIINIYLYTTEKKKIIMWLNKNKAFINDKEHILDSPLVLKNERTLVPLRFIAEAFGAEIYWDNEDKRVDYILSKQKISLWIDNNVVEIITGNELRTFIIDTNPIIINNRTCIPLRFISENIGASIEWNQYEKKISIEFPKNDVIPEDNKNIYYSGITSDDLKSLIYTNNQIKIIDVRHPFEFENYHIPNSVNIPLENIDIINYIELMKSDNVILYSQNELKSIHAAELLTNYGFTNVKYLIGGLNSWYYEIEH